MFQLFFNGLNSTEYSTFITYNIVVDNKKYIIIVFFIFFRLHFPYRLLSLEDKIFLNGHQSTPWLNPSTDSMQII